MTERNFKPKAVEKLAELSPAESRRRFRHGLRWWVGPYLVKLRTRIPAVADQLARMYADFPLDVSEELPDASLVVRRSGWLGSRVSIEVDGQVFYDRELLANAVPLVEWTLNLCVFHRPSVDLLLHAAVVERDGLAAILPGAAGSGKSTLCAALVHRGWRLLSDEVALLRREDRRLVPVPRPISLKEESIAKIREFAPDVRMGPVWPATAKGRLVHVYPPSDSVRRMGELAEPRWIVFPSYAPHEPMSLEPVSPAQALLECAGQGFNYDVLGRAGFLSLAAVIDQCQSYVLAYHDLGEAVAKFADLWAAADVKWGRETHGAIS